LPARPKTTRLTTETRVSSDHDKYMFMYFEYGRRHVLIVERFGNDMSGLWPKNDKGISLVPYCFKDQKSFEGLVSGVNIGWATWYSSIDDPGANNGHSLNFERTLVDGGSAYCPFFILLRQSLTVHPNRQPLVLRGRW
jgi:hypothetical protein